jgi:peroxiredoxin
VRTVGRRVARGFLEVALVFAIILALQAWRARDLLPTDERASAPSFELQDLDGRTWRNADLSGHPAILYFFAPWCSVCAASSPQLRWFSRLRGDGVRVLLIGLDWAAPSELRDYATRHRLQMPVLAGDRGTGAAYRVRGYPTYYVIDRQGRIVRRDVGLTTVPGLWLRTLGL